MSDTQPDDDWFSKDIEDFVVNPVETDNWDGEEGSSSSSIPKLPDVNFIEDYGGSYGKKSLPKSISNKPTKLKYEERRNSSHFIQSIPLKNLITISNGTPLDSFLDIIQHQNEFFETLTKSNPSDKIIQVILKILANLTKLPLDESRKYFFNSCLDIEIFWDHIIETIKSLGKSKSISLEINLNDLIKWIIEVSNFIVHNIEHDGFFVEWLEIVDTICKNDQLKEIIKEAKDNLDKKVFNEIYPTLDDIKGLTPPIDLKPNIIKGKYPNVQHYLDIHLSLLKEDFVAPIREGIQKFIENPNTKIPNLRVYRNVQLLLSQKSKLHKTECIYLNLNLIDNNIEPKDLTQSKRFMFGSLLLLTTTDDINDLILGIVVNRDNDLLYNGQVQIDLIRIYNNTKNIFNYNLILFETEIYFEPYHQVYNILKNYNETNFPLKEYLIDLKQEHEYPDYIEKKLSESSNKSKLFYKFSKFIFELKNFESWPKPNDLSFNLSQFNAFQAALTQKFCIIQGPPGTGKTFVGLKIINALLENVDSQILVICLTNHALDQFLTGILPLTHEIVRLGSMSKNKELDEYNIKKMSDKISDDRRIRTAFYIYKKNYSNLLERLEDVQERIHNENVDDTESILRLQNEMRSISRRIDDLRQIMDYLVIKDKRVIGMTTTFAARARSLLKLLKTPIVLIEETGEVLESHVIAALNENTQQVILIGDHQQLRPTTSVYELAKTYKMDISLFERLINNGFDYNTLATQHRMRPEFANLIRPTIYKNLDDAPVVKEYKNILGISKNLYFIDHQNLESVNEDETTKKNSYEAKYLLKLCNYLVLQGYSQNDITILTTYNGQMFQFFNDRKKFQNLSKIRITVADNFQGEENRIILLSLVRSNTTNTIGYLALKNRICVALSRAKEGLYIIGNMKILSTANKIWNEIQGTLSQQNAIGEVFELKCQTHENITKIMHHNDFGKIDFGGCKDICNLLMECGHVCIKICHTKWFDHKCSQCE